MKKYIIRFLSILFIALFLILIPYLIQSTPSIRSEENTLNVFCWGNYLPTEVLLEFEKRENVHIQVHYFSTNEDLLLKLRKVGGNGYDIIFPSDYAVKILVEEGFIKRLDKNRLNFISHLEPYLLNLPFDSQNQFSLPYSWETYGIAINSQIYPNLSQISLHDLFDLEAPPKNFVMISDPIESVIVFSHYLFNKTDSLKESEIALLTKTMKGLNPRIEAFADCRAKYFISSETTPIAFVKSSFITSLTTETPHIQFLLPKEGLFTSIENIALSSSCKKEDLAYKFINFLYQPEIMAKQCESFPYFPARSDALEHINNLNKRYLEVFKETEKRQDIILFHYIIPEEQIRRIWLESKI
jgi:spermidine/putrescine transport system substrate-binding protein